MPLGQQKKSCEIYFYTERFFSDKSYIQETSDTMGYTKLQNSLQSQSCLPQCSMQTQFSSLPSCGHCAVLSSSFPVRKLPMKETTSQRATTKREHEDTWLSSSSLSSVWKRREEGWWIVVIMARPPSASWRRISSTCIAVVESRPAQPHISHNWLIFFCI